MLFVIPQCNNETVSVAQEYLDRAPESVLAIAAQRALPNSVVMLKDWPDANVAVLQVGILTDSRTHAWEPSGTACRQAAVGFEQYVMHAWTITHTYVYTGCDRLLLSPQGAWGHGQGSGESAAPSSGVLQYSWIYVALKVVYQAHP